MLNLRPVDISNTNIDIWFRHRGDTTKHLENYWFDLDRAHEPDWERHISMKTWCTPEIEQALAMALHAARAPGFKPPPLKGVYCIKSRTSDHWKVGMSSDIRQRISGIDAAGPLKVYLVLAIPSAQPRVIESALMHELAPFRGAGEWFEMLPEDYGALYSAVEKVAGGGEVVVGDGYPHQGEVTGFPWFEARVREHSPHLFVDEADR